MDCPKLGQHHWNEGGVVLRGHPLLPSATRCVQNIPVAKQNLTRLISPLRGIEYQKVDATKPVRHDRGSNCIQYGKGADKDIVLSGGILHGCTTFSIQLVYSEPIHHTICQVYKLTKPLCLFEVMVALVWYIHFAHVSIFFLLRVQGLRVGGGGLFGLKAPAFWECPLAAHSQRC